MKKAHINQVLAGLKAIHLPKIGNKELRNTLIQNHIKLLSEKRELEIKVKDIETAFLGSYENERAEIAALQNKAIAEKNEVKKAAINAEIATHGSFFKALNECNTSITRLLDEEVNLPNAVKCEDFIAAVDDQDLDFDGLESIFPMFDGA